MSNVVMVYILHLPFMTSNGNKNVYAFQLDIPVFLLPQNVIQNLLTKFTSWSLYYLLLLCLQKKQANKQKNNIQKGIKITTHNQIKLKRRVHECDVLVIWYARQILCEILKINCDSLQTLLKFSWYFSD